MRTVSKYAFVFLLTILILPLSADAQNGFSVRSDEGDFLFSIELETGAADSIGDSGFNDIECLAFNLSGDTLYGVNDAEGDNPVELVTCDTGTGQCTALFSLGIIGDNFAQCGLTFACDGTLYLSQGLDSENGRTFRSIDLETQQITEIGEQGEAVAGLTSRLGDELCPSGVFGMGVGLDARNTAGLGCMDVETGDFELIGLFENVDVVDGGLDFDENGVLWGIADGDQEVGVDPLIFTINVETGEATVAAQTLVGFESLGIAPPFCGEEPVVAEIPTLSEWGLIATAAVLGVAGIMFVYFRRRAVA